MKAVIVKEEGKTPVFVTDFKKPEVTSTTDVLLRVKAVAIKNLDRAIASGQHYSVQGTAFAPFVIGTDGVGELENGQRVYGFGLKGMLSEYALVNKDQLVPLPENIDLATAAALPNALMGSVIALVLRAQLKKGDVVLINGATGVTGQVAVQMARYYGASKIIVTGRNSSVLADLKQLGADTVISLQQDQNQLITSFEQVHRKTPITIVLDYVWGASASAILTALKGKGSYQHKMKFVNVGAMSGDCMELSSSILRGTDIALLGSGIGSWTPIEMKRFFREFLPEAFALVAANKIKINTATYSWKNVENIWNAVLAGGQRLVFELEE